jgi:hypothetical protein
MEQFVQAFSLSTVEISEHYKRLETQVRWLQLLESAILRKVSYLPETENNKLINGTIQLRIHERQQPGGTCVA